VWENRGKNKHFFQNVKSFIVKIVEIPEDILLGEAGEQNKNIWVFIDKSMFEVSESKERLNIFDFS